MSTFLVYLYKKKTLKTSQTSIHIHTSVHQILCSNSEILCSDSVLPVLSFALLTTFFSPCFTCPILSLGHSALVAITSWAQRTGGYYLLGTAHWWLLPLGHSALVAITSWAQRTGGYYLLGIPKWVLLPLVCLLIYVQLKKQYVYSDKMIFLQR